MNSALPDSTPPYAPSPEASPTLAFVLSALAHGVLVALLVWGVRIQSQAPAAIEAELWSALPQLAAPAPVETPPPPAVPEEATKPVPEVAPPLSPQPPDIALEKKPAPKVQTEVPPKAPPKAPPKVTPQLTPPPAVRAETKPDSSAQRQAALKASFEREQKRLLEFAGAGAVGSAAVSSSPRGDASWMARAATLIKANTVFNAEGLAENLSVELEVQLDPAGYVVQVLKRRSSGVSGFDEAVERAVRKSEPYPPGVSGKVPTSFVLTHKLRE